MGRSLARRLEAALLPPEDTDEPEARPSTTNRILDAATRRFSEVGVASTTMSSIAAEAELSREWLYRHYANKDAVVSAVIQRELRRFIDGLASSVDWDGDVAELLTESFVFCVEFFRDHPMIDGIVDRGVQATPDEVRSRSRSMVTLAVTTCSAYLVDLGGLEPHRAAVVAETLVRLVGSTLVASRAQLDLHDPATLRDFAGRVVPAIVDGC